jgi:hypothetical protein
LEASAADVVLRGGRGNIEVAICNERNMTSLAARFKRLRNAFGALPAADRQEPIVVRHAALEISSGARKTREYQEDLKRLGVRFIQPGAEALATLDAVRSLMSDARSGDLSVRGETLEPAEVGRWLVTQTTSLLSEFLAQIEGAVAGAGKPGSAAVVGPS